MLKMIQSFKIQKLQLMLHFSIILDFTDFSQLEQFEKMANSGTSSIEFLLWAMKPNLVLKCVCILWGVIYWVIQTSGVPKSSLRLEAQESSVLFIRYMDFCIPLKIEQLAIIKAGFAMAIFLRSSPGNVLDALRHNFLRFAHDDFLLWRAI